MDYSPALVFLLIALVLIVIELVVMQFSVFWFLFLGLGALITALVCWAFPALSWTAATGVFLVASILTVAVLFPRLKRWQDKPSEIAGHDAIGQTVQVVAAITGGKPGKVMWSGTEWPAQKAPGEADFAVGVSAVIEEIEGIRLTVRHMD